MFCNQCGQENSSDAKFCSQCGNRLEIQNTNAQQVQIKRPQINKSSSPFRHVWLRFLFAVSLIMLLGVLPYQIISGEFKLSYIFGALFWIWVCKYTYTQIFFKKNKPNPYESFNAFDEAEAWFDKQEFLKSSINFSSYNDPYLIKNTGAILLVGMGKKVNGDLAGFAVEVKQGSGVLSSLIIEPEGIAAHHKKAAHIANMEGKHLIDVLNQMAIEHRIKHGPY